MINKKGESSIGNILRFAVPAFIILVVFFGGLPTIINIFSFVNKVPAWIWIIFGVMILFMVIKKK